MIHRCLWAEKHPELTAYHDDEWGTPLKDSKKLFEAIVLDCAQAGLSWFTILRRRDGYRAAFDNFEPQKVAAYTEKDMERLMADERIVKNESKIRSAIENAKAYCKMADRGRDFSDWLWAFVDHKPIVHYYKTEKEIPSTTDLSDRIAKSLKRRGFTFIGSTNTYAFMQAVGMVNDHILGCFRHPDYQEPDS
ncbi:MAG: DNA-3-methyladenine glycosylase I [Treponema sp.]|jgi:DNA-3-methyladenine glycosylase I|nr:DNA-3-methyladenine glycosylase I [Treponema sp.]